MHISGKSQKNLRYISDIKAYISAILKLLYRLSSTILYLFISCWLDMIFPLKLRFADGNVCFNLGQIVFNVSHIFCIWILSGFSLKCNFYIIFSYCLNCSTRYKLVKGWNQCISCKEKTSTGLYYWGDREVWGLQIYMP